MISGRHEKTKNKKGTGRGQKNSSLNVRIPEEKQTSHP
jgi:hypothetical protein